ncbi:hypothetical protein BV898_12045 [Hypsibius exemplaris]|uniref:Uncharacterized protein n=1 Tax=Hypsibius exemplaris TaxID=2072580 RepID=A0A1W0WET8_HYPEX|nr:hypothetical protein BV898_12045 [Hypsibius exemplaris]
MNSECHGLTVELPNLTAYHSLKPSKFPTNRRPSVRRSTVPPSGQGGGQTANTFPQHHPTKDFPGAAELRLSGSTFMSVHTKWFEQFYLTGPLLEEFGISVNVKIRKEHRTEAFGEFNVFFNILIVKLERPYDETYDIIGHRVFTTPARDQTSTPSTEFVAS